MLLINSFEPISDETRQVRKKYIEDLVKNETDMESKDLDHKGEDDHKVNINREDTAKTTAVIYFIQILIKSQKYTKIFEEKMHKIEDPQAKYSLLSIYYTGSKNFKEALAYSSIAEMYDPFFRVNTAYCMDMHLHFIPQSGRPFGSTKGKVDAAEFTFIANGYELGIKLGYFTSIWNLAVFYHNNGRYKDALKLYKTYFEKVKTGEYIDDDHKSIEESIILCKRKL